MSYMDPNSIETFEARHATCDDDDDPEVASEIVFTLMSDGRLSVDVWGKGRMPHCQLAMHMLTKEATDKLLRYLTQAAL